MLMSSAKWPNSIIHSNPVCVYWVVLKVISWGDFKHKLEACQPFICNRFLQFWPGVFPIFLLAITDLERQSGFVQNKICYMNPHLSWDGVWFPNWAAVLASVRLKELERRAYYRAMVEYLRFCKQSRQRATVASARMFMERHSESGFGRGRDPVLGGLCVRTFGGENTVRS